MQLPRNPQEQVEAIVRELPPQYMIDYCADRMRRHHLTLDEMRELVEQGIEATDNADMLTKADVTRLFLAINWRAN